MKILNKIWGISLLALLLIVAAPHTSRAQNEYISEQDFYDELSPYGTWVSDPQYGDVWIPDVAEDFRPYQTRGHWVLTEYGNTWVSAYPWGWATFHYGRWRYDNFYGWEWIPGYEWAPAWVSWRHGGGYYGWAPLTPGISISLSFGSSYRVPDAYWAFAPEAYINRPNIYNYYVPHTRVVNIIRNTTVINNTYTNGDRRYIAGPLAADIQRYTHQRPRVYSINDAARPGAMNVQNNTVNMFRPAVKRNGDARPQRVVDANAYKQQNPNQGIASRGPGGAAGFNHDNAAKLANVARNANDNNNVVRVNNRPNNDQQGRRPDQQGNRRPDQQRDNSSNGQPATQPAQNQPGNRPVFTPNRGGRPEDRPKVGQPAQTPPVQTQPGQQPAFNRGGGRNGNDNRPATTQPNNDLQQKQQQLNNEQRTLRQQKRQEYQREQQLQTLPQIAPPASINGQTPIQQQQMAIRDQQRQLREQQRQQDQAKQQQQAQRDQQRAQQQQTQQAQQQQAQQAQQQQAQQQQAQRDQQKQAQQQAQQAQQQRGQAQQQEQQRAQRDQQKQAQQAAQQQQQAPQQQRAQQQQRQQQRRPPEPVKPVNQ